MKTPGKRRAQPLAEPEELRSGAENPRAPAGESRPAEECLESHVRYRALADASFEAVAVHDAGTLLEANRAFAELFGYKTHELVGLQAEDLITQESLPIVFENVRKGVENAYVAQCKRRDGSTFTAEIRGRRIPYGKRTVRVIALRDISAAVRCGEALRESEERYRALLDRSSDLVYVHDFEGNLIDANETALRRLGLKREDIPSVNFGSFLDAGQAAAALQNTRNLLETGEDQGPVECTLVSRSGAAIIVETRACLIYREGRPTAVLGIARDITERRRSEQRLRESNDIINRSPAVAFLWKNAEGWPVEYVSENVHQIFGHTAEDFMSGEVPFASVIHRDDLQKIAAEVDSCSREPRQMEFTQTYRIVTRRGEVKWVDDRTYIRRDSGGRVTHFQGIVIDITEQRRAEEDKERLRAQLLQSQKMEAIGTLAGGIAHDFNNLLTSINGYSELVSNQLKQDDPVRRDVEEILKAGRRAASLTRQLLAFSRRQMLQPRILDMNAVVSDVNKMLRRVIGEDIVMQTRLAPDLHKVRADIGNIEQVLMNLVTNAREAMPNGGVLTIRTRNADAAEMDPGCTACAQPGRFVCIEVADTGVGMAPDVAERAFEPFFSTKEIGTGSGLGLSVVYGIARQHGGWVTAKSEPGCGSVFRIFFPAAIEGADCGSDDNPAAEPSAGAGRRILLVEDEEGVRSLAARILREKGFRVHAAASACEATDVFERDHGEFDLVFCDVVLPDGNGVGLVDRLTSMKPGLRALMSSGYSDSKSRWNMIQEKKMAFLSKPYNANDLVSAVQAALGTCPAVPEPLSGHAG